MSREGEVCSAKCRLDWGFRRHVRWLPARVVGTMGLGPAAGAVTAKHLLVTNRKYAARMVPKSTASTAGNNYWTINEPWIFPNF